MLNNLLDQDGYKVLVEEWEDGVKFNRLNDEGFAIKHRCLLRGYLELFRLAPVTQFVANIEARRERKELGRAAR